MVPDKIENKIRKHGISFKAAANGLYLAISTQPNFSIHLVFAILVPIFAWVLGVSISEVTILIVMIFLVLAAEMINTAIESVTDLVKKEYSEEAKIAKDVSAGMVLLSAFSAVTVGILIFGKYFLLR